MNDAIIVVRMLPPNECSPNARVHWRRKARAVKMFRTEACRAAQCEATPGVDVFCGYPLPIVLDAEIAWCCGRRRMDDDNARASLKPLVDGISDWLWHGRDDHVRIGEVVQSRGDGIVTVTLRAERGSADPSGRSGALGEGR